MGGVCDLWGTEDMHTGLWRRNLFQRARLDDLGVDGKNNIKVDFQEVVGGHGLELSGSG
jgi:hypothetical protein